MFRSDEEAAHQRADALQRDLDASHALVDQLRRELANANARLASIEITDATTLRMQLHRLADQLSCTQQLLEASESERRRLTALVEPPRVDKPRRRYANHPGARSGSMEVGIAMAILLLLVVAVAILRS